MKVAIVGSRRYENKKKIKDFVFKLKEQYGTDTIIVSGGCKTGADKYAKKYALELGLQYEEYPPFHDVHNLYCTMPSSSNASLRNLFKPLDTLFILTVPLAGENFCTLFCGNIAFSHSLLLTIKYSTSILSIG